MQHKQRVGGKAMQLPEGAVAGRALHNWGKPTADGSCKLQIEYHEMAHVSETPAMSNTFTSHANAFAFDQIAPSVHDPCDSHCKACQQRVLSNKAHPHHAMLLSSLRALRSCSQNHLQRSSVSALSAALHSAAGGEGGGGGGGEAPPVADASQQPTSGTPAASPTVRSEDLTHHPELQQVISIDRSALFNPQPHSHDAAELSAQTAAAGVEKEPETSLVRHLKALIRVSTT